MVSETCYFVKNYAKTSLPDADHHIVASYDRDGAEFAVHDRARSALGQRALERPTVLVTNQHSLSDAEDLTEGYRTLKLGKVVGEPTSGWIIYTWGATLFDSTTFRLPRQLILGSDGKNMEMNPRAVDVPVTRPIGETLTGKDSQLDKAVRELLGN